MKKFEFRLDSVLRYREHLERMALMKLAEAKRSFVLTKKRIETLEQNQTEATLTLRDEETRGIDVKRHRIFLAYLQGLTDQIAAEKNRLVEISALIREKQQIFETERIKRESLELLKKTERARYVREWERAEQKAMDEITSLRWKSKEVDSEHGASS
jgi:flagellar FliJ protein